MTRLALSIMFTTVCLPAVAAEPTLSVGFASADVTPDLGRKPVFLAGFGQNRIATTVHDPIMVRATVLSDGTDKVALVAVDVVGLFLPTAERVREKLPGFRYVLVSATHNHEGPDTLGLWGRSQFQSGVDPDYLTNVVDGVVKAVRTADASRVPATAKVGTATGPDLVRDNRLPDVKLDTLAVVRFEEPGTGRPVGLIVQWNCHPETLDSKNTEISADFVAATVKHLEVSQKCPVTYLTGSVGGLMTSLGLEVRDADGKPLADGTFAKTERYGRLVGELADAAVSRAVPATLTPFEVRTKSVLVPVDNPLYRLGWQTGVLKRPIYEWVGDPSPAKVVETKDATKPAAIRTEVGYLKLGELDVAVIPGEIYPELMLGKVQDPPDAGADFPEAKPEPAIYSQLRGKHRLVVGLANDEIGYIIPKRQWDEKPPFCYGRAKAQYGETNSVSPEAAGIVCEAFRGLVKSKE
jgi:hypothetical protein